MRGMGVYVPTNRIMVITCSNRQGYGEESGMRNTGWA